jgi:hypothetical protein
VHSGSSTDPGQAINIVFDGQAAPESGQFVEVEIDDGTASALAKWLKRPDDYWSLRIENVHIPSPDVISSPDEAARDVLNPWAPQPDGTEPKLSADVPGAPSNSDWPSQ